MARHRYSLTGQACAPRPPDPARPGGSTSHARSPQSLTPARTLCSRVVMTAVTSGALAAGSQAVPPPHLPPVADERDVVPAGMEQALDAAPGPHRTSGSPDDNASPATAVSTPAPLVPILSGGNSLKPARTVIADTTLLVKAAARQRRVVEQAARAAESDRVASQAVKPDRSASGTEPDWLAAERLRAKGPSTRTAAAPLANVVQLVNGRVTSGFGARWNAQHGGLDIAAAVGTPIRVPLDGTVIDSGPASGFGLWVRVRHADGTITVYGHINRSTVRVGETVAAGQVIAEVGNRGRSTGPHLHIEVVKVGGKKVDPRSWLDARDISY